MAGLSTHEIIISQFFGEAGIFFDPDNYQDYLAYCQQGNTTYRPNHNTNHYTDRRNWMYFAQ